MVGKMQISHEMVVDLVLVAHVLQDPVPDGWEIGRELRHLRPGPEMLHLKDPKGDLTTGLLPCSTLRAREGVGQHLAAEALGQLRHGIF